MRRVRTSVTDEWLWYLLWVAEKHELHKIMIGRLSLHDSYKILKKSGGIDLMYREKEETNEQQRKRNSEDPEETE